MVLIWAIAATIITAIDNRQLTAIDTLGHQKVFAGQVTAK